MSSYYRRSDTVRIAFLGFAMLVLAMAYGAGFASGAGGISVNGTYTTNSTVNSTPTCAYPSHYLFVSAGQGGSASGSGCYTYGTKVLIVSHPSSGYTVASPAFAGSEYTGGCYPTSNGCVAGFTMPDTSITETAYFSSTTGIYSITVGASPSACAQLNLTSPGSGTYSKSAGTSVPLSAAAGGGNSAYTCTFTGWTGTGSGSYTGPSQSPSVTVDGNIQETADYKYASIPYPITITAFPSSDTVYAGNSIVLTANVSGGTPPYAYQWYNDTRPAGAVVSVVTAVPGATSSTLKITAEGSTHTYSYYVQATGANGASARSANVTLTVKARQLQNATIPTYHVTVRDSPSGSGYEGVASNTVGYTCDQPEQSCTYNFTAGTPITLYAYEFSNTTFKGWSGIGGTGAISSSSSRVSTTVNSNIVETASFTNQTVHELPTITLRCNPSYACNDSALYISTEGAVARGQDNPLPVAAGLKACIAEAPSNATSFTGWTGSAYSGFGYPTGNGSQAVACFTMTQNSAIETANYNSITVVKNITSSACNNLPVTLHLNSTNDCGDFGVQLVGLGQPNDNGSSSAILNILYKGKLNSTYGGTSTFMPGESSLVVVSNATNVTYFTMHLSSTFPGLYAYQKWAVIQMSVSNTPPPSYKLTFHKGWNLFSVPLAYVTSYAASSCALESNLWALINGKYEKTANMEGGSGYWMEVPQNCSVIVSGPALNQSHYVTLTAGWNMVGSLPTAINISSVDGTCNVMKGPYAYNASTGYHATSELVPGKGYLIDVRNSCFLGLLGGNSSAGGGPPALP